MVSSGAATQGFERTTSSQHLQNLVPIDHPVDDCSYVPIHEINSHGGRTKRSNSVIFNILVEDEAKRLVSCENIETNLIADRNKSQTSDQEYIVNENKEEDDSYWYMPPQSSEEEHDFSVAQVERLLVEDAVRRLKEEGQVFEKCSNIKDDSQGDENYWDWPAEPVPESEKNQSLIDSMIVEATSTSQFATDYWYWNPEEESTEVTAPHVRDPTHPNHSYWDFPHESKDPQTLKNNLIENILKEERIRNILSCETIEANELEHRRTKKAKLECRSIPNSTVTPSNYWDFHSGKQETLAQLDEIPRQELVKKIFKKEKLSFILSTENIEKNLKIDRETLLHKKCNYVEGTLSESTSYWMW